MSTWMEDYYNGDALSGGWSYANAIPVNDPDISQMTNYGLQIAGMQSPDTQAKLRRIMEKTNCGLDQIYQCIGLTAVMDALAIQSRVAKKAQDRVLAKTRSRLLRSKFKENIIKLPCFNRVRSLFHMTDAATKRRIKRSLIAPGPYVPYQMPYAWAPNAIKLTRQGHLYPGGKGTKGYVLSDGANWRQLNPAIARVFATTQDPWPEALKQKVSQYARANIERLKQSNQAITKQMLGAALGAASKQARQEYRNGFNAGVAAASAPILQGVPQIVMPSTGPSAPILQGVPQIVMPSTGASTGASALLPEVPLFIPPTTNTVNMTDEGEDEALL